MYNEKYGNDDEEEEESSDDYFLESLPKNPLIINEEKDKTLQKVKSIESKAKE